MVFGADADRLIVTATPADVRRYAAGQLVTVGPYVAGDTDAALRLLRESGYVVRPDEWWARRADISGQSSEPPVYAVLRTLCGCWQDRWVPGPAPREIKFPIVSGHWRPLTNDISTFDHTFDVRVFSMRRFETVAVEPGMPPLRRAIYEEQPN